MFSFILMIIVFVLGYIAIANEQPLKVDKAASAIVLGVVIWIIYIFGITEILNLGYSSSWLEFLKSNELADFKRMNPQASVLEQMKYFVSYYETTWHLGDLSQILFFLLGAMTIVETVDAHQGFKIITDEIKTTRKVKLLWIIAIIAFLMSAVLDNMTTTIVMIALLRKLIDDKKARWFFASIIVIAANAGGAFSPIGDVTTIMLWIGGQVDAIDIIKMVFIPSLFSLLVPLTVVSFYVKGNIEKHVPNSRETNKADSRSWIMLVLGIGGLISVPFFKEVTDLPPYMGMLLSLGIIWIVTEIIHKRLPGEEKKGVSVVEVLKKVDIPTILFYLGILLAVAALESAGHLQLTADFFDKNIHNIYGINVAIGLLSSIVDNVPLTAGAMGMYPILTPEIVQASANPEFTQHFIQNGAFWELLAYAAGTGGSILIIGSAAGVAAMALEKIDFIWYMKKISWLAILGYFSGILVFWLQSIFLFHK